MPSDSGSEYMLVDGDSSGSEYVSDMDIDPLLSLSTNAKPANGQTKLANQDIQLALLMLNSDDDDDDPAFSGPIIFSDSEDGHDDLGDGYSLRDGIKGAQGFKIRGKLRSAGGFRRRAMNAADPANDPEIRSHISKANEAFVMGELSTAWEHYSEVIKLDPKCFVAYRTLGEICQMRNQMNKCCLYWLLAAECGEADDQFWGLVAELSVELGHITQAIHCYTKAIAKLDGKSGHFILERSMLYKQIKQYGRALEGFQRLHKMYPTDNSIVKNLASVYVEQKRLNDAINLYIRVLEANRNPQPNVQYPKFSWSDLNIISELFQSQHSWRPAVKLIKLVARWKQNREDETWWDEQDDDAEFDEQRRRKVLFAKKPTQTEAFMHRGFELPIDIRFKLGCFRLELDQKDEAIAHFRYLFKQSLEEVADLFYDAGCLLESKGYYVEAIQFLSSSYTPEENKELGHILGKCLLEVEDYIRAKDTLLKALFLDPENVDLKLLLIEAYYHTGDMSKAARLMEEVSQTRVSQIKARTAAQGEESIYDEDDDEGLQEDNLALIKNSVHGVEQRIRLSQEEQIQIEVNATKMALNKFNRMNRLQEAIEKGHHVAASAWMKLASQLIEMFMEVRSLFPKNRRTTFKGIHTYKRKKSMAFDDKLMRLYNLYEGITQTDNSKLELVSQTEYRGLSYDQWLYIFIQYAMLLRQFDNNLEEATLILNVAQDVSVFVQDKNRLMLLRMVRLVIAIVQEDYPVTVPNYVRWLLVSGQFSPTIYDIFMCCFSSGIAAWASFSNYNHQKYFLRHVKAYDSLLTSTKISGAANLTSEVKGLKLSREHPQLLYIYACLLGSNRSYSSPIVYLTRVYREYYKDPTICFSLGLAHVHRSMQRNSSNRHLQVLQGLSYLMEYREARLINATIYEKQEIEYNYGRLFHMIGLPSLAVKHYEKVLDFHEQLLDDPEYDMLMEAAYNLSLIYTINGNSKKSQSLYEKYLTI
ncbi:hypothetical protein PUMCH_002197 [Australozyma saopauloensis]|uniref:Uncharacterized protein n=1 Tax=Australozyma saopauloensis TaxID=291208 RepID=A0AAX4H8T4_9ASCO|nr:hypothetical protein PUMCH_002197 [[Candida] saopauloensis]